MRLFLRVELRHKGPGWDTFTIGEYKVTRYSLPRLEAVVHKSPLTNVKFDSRGLI